MALVELQDSCRDGTIAGRKAINDLWKNDCNNAWGLEKSAKRMKDRSYPSTARNPRDAAYNKCARDAIDKEVKSIEKKCFDDSPSECEEVGELAASVIVNTQVCKSEHYYSKHNSYKKTCRTVATGICQGQITAKIREFCPSDMPSTTKLRNLQNKCSEEVKNLTPNNGDFDLSGVATVRRWFKAFICLFNTKNFPIFSSDPVFFCFLPHRSCLISQPPSTRRMHRLGPPTTRRRHRLGPPTLRRRHRLGPPTTRRRH